MATHDVSDAEDLEEPNSSADAIQTSSRQLQRELAAPDGTTTSPSAIAGKHWIHEAPARAPPLGRCSCPPSSRCFWEHILVACCTCS